MEPEFITYQKFNDTTLANELAEQLDKNGIEYYIEEEEFRFDPSMVMNNAVKEYAVKVRSKDFEHVNELLNENEARNVAEIDKDYYLFSFSDDELIEVITKADEWSAFDNVLARKLLTERGKPISEETIAAIHEKRIEELKEPDPPQTFWIVLGYIVAMLGGVLGIFIGWHLFTYKKTIPNGERIFGYTESDRKHGKRIFYLSIIVFVIAIIYRIVQMFN